ncbi:MAG: DUF1508 domain-containing protein [Pseudomonadota bacterium]
MSKLRKGKVEFYKDRKGQHRWRLIASNGRVVADSAEGYVTKAACENGFVAVASLVETARWSNAAR